MAHSRNDIRVFFVLYLWHGNSNQECDSVAKATQSNVVKVKEARVAWSGSSRLYAFKAPVAETDEFSHFVV